MISVTGGISGTPSILSKVALLKNPDFLALMEMIARRLEEGANRDRKAGVGANGQFDDIKQSTVDRRRQQGRGDGPPLRPDDASRFANLATTPTLIPGGFRVVGDWPGTEGFIGYHMEGTPNMVARNPVFISPETLAEIRSDIIGFYRAILARTFT